MSISVNFHAAEVDPDWVERFALGLGVPYGEEELYVKSKRILIHERQLTTLTNILVDTIFEEGDMYTYYQVTPDVYKLLVKAVDVEILRLKHNGPSDIQYRELNDLQQFRRKLEALSQVMETEIVAVAWG